MSSFYGVFLSLLAGIGLALQPTFNAELARRTATTLWASLISVSCSAILLLIAIAVLRSPFLRIAERTEIPWWAWLGGVFGAVYVTVTLWAVDKVGVSAVLTMVVAGQLIGGTLIDHYGLFNVPARPLDYQKLFGILLLALGALIVLNTNSS